MLNRKTASLQYVIHIIYLKAQNYAQGLFTMNTCSYTIFCKGASIADHCLLSFHIMNGIGSYGAKESVAIGEE